MECESTSEQEMLKCDNPKPQTIDELKEYIESLVGRNHDYGTSCYAMSLAAVAAFEFVARELGASGAQASFASGDIVRRTTGIKGPFVIIDGMKMLYPQYNLQNTLREAMCEWGGWASAEATAMLEKHHDDNLVSPNVLAHWKRLAGYGHTAKE